MYGVDSSFGAPLQCDVDDDSGLSIYTLLILITGLAGLTYSLARFAESQNSLNYDSRAARLIAGFLMVMMRMWHTNRGDLEIINPEGRLLAVGPHRTSLDAFVVASKITGTPPRFFATDAFDAVPGISSLLNMFNVIPVAANGSKGENGRSANAKALEDASKALNEKGCVALFPQGNFSKLGQEPPRVYAGTAKLALENKIPIHVIRLDGFWSLQNPLIPIVIRNNTFYRAFLSAFHMNNVRATLCCEIDFHLKPENESLSDEEKIQEISAQLYAYFRHTGELNGEEIKTIKTEIESRTHFLIWNNKVQRDDLGKRLLTLKKEGAELEQKSPISRAYSMT